jgi:hypothetical protein
VEADHLFESSSEYRVRAKPQWREEIYDVTATRYTHHHISAMVMRLLGRKMESFILNLKNVWWSVYCCFYTRAG